LKSIWPAWAWFDSKKNRNGRRDLSKDDADALGRLDWRLMLPLFAVVTLYPAGIGAVLPVLPFYSREMGASPFVLDREVAEKVKRDETARRLMTIPGIGPVTAVALTALAPPVETLSRERDLAAWVGLTPLEHSTGGTQKLGATSKREERTLRRLLIIGANSVLSRVATVLRQGRGLPVCWRASRRCWCGWR
jgi:hypothetical protein